MKQNKDKINDRRNSDLTGYGIQDEGPYGWLGCYPKSLQCCNVIGWFTFSMMTFAFIKQYAFEGCLGAIVTTLEKRYSLNSKSSGFIFSAYDTAFIVTVIPIAHFTRNMRKPMVIGCAMILLAVGSAVFLIPQFVSEPYAPYGSGTATCDPNRNLTCTADDVDSALDRKYYGLFVFGAILIGVAAVPIWTTGVSHVENQAREATGPLLIGLIQASATIGILVGVGTTSTLNLNQHVDFTRDEQSEIDITNYNWVGAWWLSYCAAAAFGIIFSIPMFGYPKQLPGVAEIKFTENRQKQVKTEDTELAKLVEMTKKIWTNPIMVAIIFAQIAETILESGISAFGLKYVEQQYYLTAMEAGVFAAVSMIIAAVIGIIVNGLIMKYVEMNRQQCLLLYLVQTAMAVFLFIPLFFIKCDNRVVDGVFDVDGTPFSTPNFSPIFLDPNVTITEACQCADTVFDPYCVEGTDGLKTTYFSPCYAGCNNSVNFFDPGLNATIATYGGCELAGIIAKPGYCNKECSHVPIAYVVFFFAIMFSVGPTIVNQTVLLRSTSEESKPLVLATNMFVGKLVGGIPGPVIWGALIDDSCIKGKEDCDGNFLTCQIYDADDVTKRFVGAAMMFKGLVILSISLCLVFTIREERSKVEPQKIVEHELT